MAAQVMFVTSVGADGTGGTTRLDLSPGNTGGLQIGEGCTFDRPELDATTADAAITDGSPYVASAYVNRKIHLQVVLPRVVSMDARQAALTALARELDRDVNVLMVRPDGATKARWLVTYRAAAAVAWLLLRATATLAEVVIDLEGQPFAFGEQTFVTELAGAVLDGNVETGTWTVDVAPVAGDVDVPLALVVWNAGVAGSVAGRFALAAKPVVYDDVPGIAYWRGTASPTPANTAVVSDATAAGGTATRWTPPGTGLAYVFGGEAFNTGSVTAGSRAVLGRWRLLARVKRSSSAAVFQLTARLRPGVTAGTNLGAALAPTPTVFGTPAASGWAYVDLGVMQVPTSGQWTADPYGNPPRSSTPKIDLMAQRVTGSGTLDVDHMLVLPADGRYIGIDVSALDLSDVSSGVYLDGDRNVVYPFESLGAPPSNSVVSAGQPPVSWVGGMLRLSPRYTTRVFGIAAATNPASLTSTLNLVGYYRPRYLDVQ